MPAPSDPQSSSTPPETPGAAPVEPTSPGAARLLDEIRERLERLEGNLSLRERRVARLERTLRDADGKLQTERARYAAERESIEKGLPAQLRERDEQLQAAARDRQQLEQRLAAQTRHEREMIERIDKLTVERDQAAAYLEKAQQEIREVQRSHRELEAQLEDITKRRDEWEKAMAAATPVHRRADAAPPVELPRWAKPIVTLAQRYQKLSGLQRLAVATTALVLPIVCIIAAVTTYRHYPRTWRVEGAVVAPVEASPGLLARFERPPVKPGEVVFDSIEVSHSGATPLLATSMLVHDWSPRRGIEQVNAELQNIARQLAASTQPASEAERRQNYERVKNELRVADARMAALASRPAEGQADPRALLAAWQKKFDERKTLDATIAQLDVKLQKPAPTVADVKLTPEQTNAALAGDPRLTADGEILGQRETELLGMIRKTMDASHQPLADLARTAAAADKQLETALNESKEQDVSESLQVVRNALANCAKAGVALDKIWQDGRKTVDAAAPGLDVPAHHQAIQAAARDFVESTTNSLGLLRKSLEAIGNGGDNPTTRGILHNTIAQQVQPALDAREAVATVARQLLPGENVELGTLVQSVTGLHTQVVERRTRLERGLRDQALADLRTAHESELQQAKAQRDELARKAAGMEAEIVHGAGEALALLGGSQAREAALLELVEMTRKRPELAAKVAAFESPDSPENALARRLGGVTVQPAAATDLTSAGAVAAWTVIGGMAPVLLLALVGSGFYAVRTWRKPRGSLDEYTRALTRPRRAPAKKTARG